MRIVDGSVEDETIQRDGGRSRMTLGQRMTAVNRKVESLDSYDTGGDLSVLVTEGEGLPN